MDHFGPKIGASHNSRSAVRKLLVNTQILIFLYCFTNNHWYLFVFTPYFMYTLKLQFLLLFYENSGHKIVFKYFWITVTSNWKILFLRE